MIPIYTMLLFVVCSEEKTPKTDSVFPDLEMDTGDAETDDTNESDLEDLDNTELNRKGQVRCSAGGLIQGSSISGSYCFAPVDLSSGTPSTSTSYQWQPGPITPVSP